MRALIWISEQAWEAVIDQARALVPERAEVTLMHVAPADVEGLAAGGRAGLLGRRLPPPPGPPVTAVSDEQARALLRQAQVRLARPAEVVARRGRVEREIVAASAQADLLILARDGEPRPGPKSLGPRARFVVDHAVCPVIVIWGRQPESPNRAD